MHRLSTRSAARLRRHAALFTVLALAGLASACTGLGDGGSGATPVATNADGLATTADGSIVLNAQNFGYSLEDCPPVAIRPGTEALTVLQPGKKDEVTGAGPPVQYQASIVKTARDCRKADGGGVVVRLGVIGRVVSGPAGKAGTVTLPLRVVVMEGTDKVIKSELFKISVNLTAPDFGADFTKIDDTIQVPISEGNTNFRIYVGFDEGKKPTPAT
jgi:hypothetical protein